ncbi:hypothetical protein KIP88_19730 [Bradyrhizobium sp. SRL28]|uniref:hypothetical protein n=1 Tax=Bradyrhizobium sp. SRL28 TaxID=2836178 RepID=UPI001BDE31B5|nr:hypothetical protein [Bradyrhizobium sp. SRL28]MBT1512734.1 hypothetical protein [Bradyrhizobium sp. SRL28]
MANAEGWAIELQGDKIDIDDARASLQPPFDPWMEDYSVGAGSTVPLLRTTAWATFTEASDVTRDAQRIVERLNGGALLIHSDAKPLCVGGVLKFDAAGNRMPIIFTAAGQITLTGGRARGRVSAAASGTPTESSMQRWLREADADDDRAALFSHLARAENWYDLYKSAELVRKLAGGNSALRTALGSDWTYWERMWRTANCYRHAPNPVDYPLPTPPAKLEESREFLFKVAPRFL